MKIVVLAAGTSTERAVSIVSGTGVCKALRELGHQAILVDVFFGWKEAVTDDDAEAAFSGPNMFTEADGSYDVEKAAAYIHSFDSRMEEEKKTRKSFFGPKVLELCEKADFVFLALHGSNGEDGRIQAAFELMGIPYSGTDYISSAISMDKSRTKQVFNAEGVTTPQGVTIYRNQKDLPRTAKGLGLELPVIVKPCCGGSSVGCTICHTEKDVEEGIRLAFSLEASAVVEEFIAGREYTDLVMDGKAYPIVEISPKDGYYDYKNKYTAGSTVETCPAPLPPEKTKEMQELAVKAYKALGITGYARFDFLIRNRDGKIFCLEANTLPGMTPTSLIPQEAAAVGINYKELCQMLIDISLRNWNDRVK
ncbi:MAG: D-alanine--D-alanine ligase [Eubacterium sp.]|nr:D-alanine--D-alanine ligase [Eubacterium sp.]